MSTVTDKTGATKWWVTAACLAVAWAAPVALFASALGFDFVNRDDDHHVLHNRLVVANGNPWSDYLFTPTIGYVVAIPVLLWRGIYRMAGDAAWAFHAVNVVVHGLNASLAFLVGRRLGLSRSWALAAALFFGLHRVTAESVCWVSNLKSLLVATFALVFALSLLGISAEHGDAAQIRRARIGCWLGFLGGALSKPVMVFAAPLGLAWPRLRQLWARSRFHTAAGLLWIAGLSELAFRSAHAQHDSFGGLDNRQSLLSLEHLREIWYAAGYHLNLLFFFAETSPVHIPPARPAPWSTGVDLAPFLVLAVLCGVSLRLEPNRLFLRRMWSWFLCFSIAGVGIVPIKRYLGDTYAYLPLVGLAWILAAIGQRFEERLPANRPSRRLLLPVVFASLMVMAPSTLASSLNWKSSVALWNQVYERYPDSPEVCLYLGHALLKTGQPAQALAQYRLCADTPAFAGFRDRYRKFQAMALMEMGEPLQAVAIFEDLRKHGRADEEIEANLRSLYGRLRGP